jgi:hypothetical protein
MDLDCNPFLPGNEKCKDAIECVKAVDRPIWRELGIFFVIIFR